MEEFTPQQILHYEIIGKLGDGVSGQVFKVWDTVRERIVALKLLNPPLIDSVGFRGNCLTALNTLSHSNHPNICSIFGFYQVGGTFMIDMEYLEGTTLRELIRLGPLNKSKFLDIAVQIGDGLKYAHEQLVTHGNLKPSNIMVTPQGVVKIMDFGLSCFAVGRELLKGKAAFEMPSYIAPEQITGEPLTPSADLFSLGALFYELLTGKQPFIGDTREAVENAILHEIPDFQILRDRKIPGDTILLIEKLLAKNPADRFSSAGELLITLREVRSFERESSRREFLQVKPKSTRQYLLISLLAILLIVLWYIVTFSPR